MKLLHFAAPEIKLLLENYFKNGKVYIDDNGGGEYTDVNWYGEYFVHPEFGKGCYVVIISLDPDNKNHYADLWFNEVDGNWEDIDDGGTKLETTEDIIKCLDNFHSLHNLSTI